MLIYSYINTSGNWKNEKLCGNTTPAGRSVFTQFRVFPIFTSVDITVYQYGKNVLYFFYNIAQKTLTEEWREIFRVDIELYQHGSSQSAFRIYKCYIIKIYICPPGAQYDVMCEESVIFFSKMLGFSGYARRVGTQ